MALKGDWVRFRKPMKKYPKTIQQIRVKIGGLLVKEVCTGKKGRDFFQCRSLVLKCAFDDKDCGAKVLELKGKLLEEIK